MDLSEAAAKPMGLTSRGVDLVRVVAVNDVSGVLHPPRCVTDAMVCVARAADVVAVHRRSRGHGRALMDAARQKETAHG
jgi:rare lipoprotein A (peptidoglycan hydrolase)